MLGNIWTIYWFAFWKPFTCIVCLFWYRTLCVRHSCTRQWTNGWWQDVVLTNSFPAKFALTQVRMQTLANFALCSAQLIGPCWPIWPLSGRLVSSIATCNSLQSTSVTREQACILNMQMMIYIYPKILWVSSSMVYAFHPTTFFQLGVYELINLKHMQLLGKNALLAHRRPAKLNIAPHKISDYVIDSVWFTINTSIITICCWQKYSKNKSLFAAI